jgi:hypothetical protein
MLRNTNTSTLQNLPVLDETGAVDPLGAAIMLSFRLIVEWILLQVLTRSESHPPLQPSKLSAALDLDAEMLGDDLFGNDENWQLLKMMIKYSGFNTSHINISIVFGSSPIIHFFKLQSKSNRYIQI